MNQATELPSPKVVRCLFARQFQPHLPAMELDWDAEVPGLEERTWFFPDRVTIKGPPPRTFGVIIGRQEDDDYQVRLVWNEMGMTWGHLRRGQILTSALAPVLRSLGTDLWDVLEQPVNGGGHSVWPVTGEKMTG